MPSRDPAEDRRFEDRARTKSPTTRRPQLAESKRGTRRAAPPPGGPRPPRAARTVVVARRRKLPNDPNADSWDDQARGSEPPTRPSEPARRFIYFRIARARLQSF